VVIRFDWGPAGADAIAPGAAVVAVIDVLSFTTTLTVAADRGIAVRPYPWADASAARFAAAHRATLAVGRSQAGDGRVSLSPGTIRYSRGIDRLVLPSPNGSAISARLAATGATVIGVSLRNAPAAAAWAAAASGPIAVVSAGERWPDGSLRPAVEDLWGAGAFLDALPGRFALSPEAGAARAAYREVAGSLATALRESVSGRELIGLGFAGDVQIAAEAGQSTAVPVLRDGWFTASDI
jgi:2-phosphosulfolactate phosphatase